jgi:hypothetical protein
MRVVVVGFNEIQDEAPPVMGVDEEGNTLPGCFITAL